MQVPTRRLLSPRIEPVEVLTVHAKRAMQRGYANKEKKNADKAWQTSYAREVQELPSRSLAVLLSVTNRYDSIRCNTLSLPAVTSAGCAGAARTTYPLL